MDRKLHGTINGNLNSSKQTARTNSMSDFLF